MHRRGLPRFNDLAAVAHSCSVGAGRYRRLAESRFRCPKCFLLGFVSDGNIRGIAS